MTALWEAQQQLLSLIHILKRKASGAQKRYEDKIKAKKKAEMDAKKAMIRAEDMKKGVFSTIGQLPKEEPRKGSIAASAAV